MAILKISKKERNFLIVETTCLKETKLSWAAKGLHSYLMSLPEDWQVKVKDLTKRATNGRDSVRGILNELENAGYISKEKTREELSGRFIGIEYTVYEFPQKNLIIKPPKTEFQDLEDCGPKNDFFAFPEPETPHPEKPCSEKAPLININNSNNTNNKITAAKESYKSAVELKNIKSAAAVLSQKIEIGSQDRRAPKQSFTAKDSIIDKELSPNQVHHVESLVQKLNWDDAENLVEEIKYCLLNPQHFTACGQDFRRKLNAIRMVIVRGDWQRPAGLVLEAPTLEKSEIKEVDTELANAYAEMSHFQKLLQAAKDNTREMIEGIIAKAQAKIYQLQEKKQQTLPSDSVSVLI